MPPKKKKQTPRNAFFHFMMEFKTRQGRNFSSMLEVSEAASPHWNRMSKEQRKPYEEMALFEKNNLKPSKYTSEGLDIDELTRQEQEEQKIIQRMKDEITSDLQTAKNKDRLGDDKIFLIHVNTHCQTSDGMYYAAEISVAAFNLKLGVDPRNVFSEIVLPGPLPLGYHADAKQLSEGTHKIPPPAKGETENNEKTVLENLVSFLSSNMAGSKRMPVLYADEKHMKMIQGVLDQWCSDYFTDRNLSFSVYNLQFFFRVLKNTVADDIVWPTDTFSNHEIEKDVYAHVDDIACKYHQVTSSVVYCSRAIVVRYAFMICDNCCPDMNIEMLPGYHVPMRANLGDFRCTSVSSSSSYDRSSRPKRDAREPRASKYPSGSRDSDLASESSKADHWETSSVTSDASTSTLTNNDSEFETPSARRGFSRRPLISTNASLNSHVSDDDSRSYAGSAGNFASATASSLSQDMANISLGNSNMRSPSEFPYSMGRGIPNAFDGSQFPPLGGRGSGPSARARGLHFPRGQTRGRRGN